MHKHITSIFLACVIASCSTGHSIKILPDGSAIVQSDAYWVDSIRCANSKIISDLTLQENGLYRFKIANLDSLGSYMGDIISDNYFTFHWQKDSLQISSSNNPPIKPKFDDNKCCGYVIQIEGDKSIKHITKKGNRLRIKQHGNKEALIYWDVNHRKKVDNRSKRVVVFYE
jgi:hypothetical protein